MRFFWCSYLATIAAIFIGGVRAPMSAQGQDAAKKEEKKTEEKKAGPSINKFDEDILRRAKLSIEPDALLEFLKKRTLPEARRPEVEKLVRLLGSSDYRVREKAALDLFERGPAALEVLRFPPTSAPDCERVRRIERSILSIHESDVPPEARVAAVRVAAAHRSKALVETLLGYVPFADYESELDELRVALTAHALKDGKPDPLLVAALTDRAPLRRAAAAEVLARVAYIDHKELFRKLLEDPDPFVRFRLARAVVLGQHREGVPILIDTLADLPVNAAWQAEDFLLSLPSSVAAPTVSLGNDRDERVKCRAAWHEWWKKNGDKVDLAKVQDSPRTLGRTLIVLLDQERVVELGPDNVPRLDVKGLTFPLDAQLLDDNRILIAEYKANKVTERNALGEVVWQKVLRNGINNGLSGPQVAQRLPNGNTFIATASHLYEYDKDDNLVVNIEVAPDGQQRIMKAAKAPNGDIVCMIADGRIVRYDKTGAELSSFPISIGNRLFGGRLHVLANGRVLVPHNGEGKVVEYDAKGNAVWSVSFEQPIAAMRLPNGNTLITSMNPAVGAVEVDRTGAHVWSYRDPGNTRVTRAIRR